MKTRQTPRKSVKDAKKQSKLGRKRSMRAVRGRLEGRTGAERHIADVAVATSANPIRDCRSISERAIRARIRAKTAETEEERLERRVHGVTQAPKKPKYPGPTDAEQFEFLLRAQEKRFKALHPSVRKHKLPSWSSPFSEDRSGELHALNPWAGGLWSKMLKSAYWEANPEEEPFFLTLFDEAWDIDPTTCRSLASTFTRLLEEAKRTVRDRLRGLPFLLLLDVAIHRLVRGDGQRLCLHWHGLGWGDPAVGPNQVSRGFHHINLVG